MRTIFGIAGLGYKNYEIDDNSIELINENF